MGPAGRCHTVFQFNANITLGTHNRVGPTLDPADGCLLFGLLSLKSPLNYMGPAVCCPEGSR